MVDTDNESAETSAIRAEARAWFTENWDPDQTLEEWWSRLADSGWGFPTWSPDWYGRGLGSQMATVVAEERKRAGAFGPPSGIGVMMAGPTIVAHGTDEQRKRFLPDMVSGKEVWCQLFSEPGSGSDLASLQTRAVRDGDEWVVNGQKVWTSGAQFSKWGILIARTDPDQPKHKGITYFVIDMDQPGVEVRPLKEMTGGATFNEVFFTDARIPQDNVLGEVGEGWGVAVTTLAHERNSLGAGGMGGMGGGEIIGRPDLSRHVGDLTKGTGGDGPMAGMAAAFGGGGGSLVKTLPQLFGKGSDPIVRQEIVSIFTLLEIARFTGLRAQAAAASGQRPGPEVSTGKLLASKIVKSLRDTGLRVEGANGMLSGSDAPLGGMIQFLALFSPAISIAGGTDEVQRNIIGERVLGLPAEPRPDKVVPFRELKVGTQVG
ncbi:MAG TPA: acyl-CoA dehydrogenase family protein [Acidimicrobiales bacterium]|jgi:alkylation response protein AidB-like acyl-CoA dehydrogenase|nr:acyl-CoA dehydrogenase family protein [Acidimicrobiales bacterium]